MQYEELSAQDGPFANVFDEALEGQPRAHELRRMYEILAERREALAEELTHAGPAEREELSRKLATLDEQIQVLREEASITEFVEDAVRVGIEMRKLQN